MYRRNQISAMLIDSRCIEGEVPGYCPPPLCNISGADPGTLRYIINNALQISQHGGYLISSVEISIAKYIDFVLQIRTNTTMFHLMLYGELLRDTNFSVNFFLYITSSRKFRQSLLMLFTKKHSNLD